MNFSPGGMCLVNVVFVCMIFDATSREAAFKAKSSLLKLNQRHVGINGTVKTCYHI